MENWMPALKMEHTNQQSFLALGFCIRFSLPLQLLKQAASSQVCSLWSMGKMLLGHRWIFLLQYHECPQEAIGRELNGSTVSSSLITSMNEQNTKTHLWRCSTSNNTFYLTTPDDLKV